jgi:peptidoglycan/LPS O-acetylase OafA/YrhL
MSRFQCHRGRLQLAPKHYDYIDALRGYAILMVIAVHSSQYFSDLSPTTKALADQGARGVQLFFVASAMTLCMSWKARHDGAIAFYIRRFFRIAPMFYLTLPVFLYFRGWGPSIYAPDGIGLRHVVMSITFTHGFMPDTITSVVPGSWSIADEMMFYAMFPLLMAIRIRIRFNTAAVLTVLATILCVVLQRYVAGAAGRIADPTWRAAWGTFYFLWLINQLPCFLFGILVARWIEEKKQVRRPAALVLLSIGLGVWVTLFPNSFPLLGKLVVPAQAGLLFAAFALGLSKWQPKLLVNPVIGWIGKVSYSGYLLHLLIITSGLSFPRENFAVVFASLAAITIGISTITYLCVEKPFNRLGRWLAQYIPPTAVSEPAPSGLASARTTGPHPSE